MEKEIIKKLEEHDKVLDKIDKRFDAIDKRLDKEFSRNDEVHSNLTKKLLEHDDRFDRIEEKISESQDKLLTKMDQILVVVKRSEDERVVGTHRMDRMQGEIDSNAKDIRKVKKVLKLA